MTSAKPTCPKCQKIFEPTFDIMRHTSCWHRCSDDQVWFQCNCKDSQTTIKLPEGHRNLYQPSRNMSGPAKSVFTTLSSLSDLPKVPTVINRLQRLSQDPNKSAAQIAQALRKDPLFASEVLGMARQFQARRDPEQKPIQALSHALSYLGGETFRQLLQMVWIRSLPLKTEIYSKEMFWKEAFLTGQIAELLGSHLSTSFSRDELYLAGTLSNLGKLVSAYVWPKRADRLQRLSDHPQTAAPWLSLELGLGYTAHTVMGEVAACLWGLPPLLIQAIRDHHHPQTQAAHEHLPTIVHFAQQLTHWTLLKPERIEKDRFSAVKAALNFGDEQIEAFLQTVLTQKQGSSGKELLAT